MGESAERFADPEQKPIPARWDMSYEGERDHLADSLRP